MLFNKVASDFRDKHMVSEAPDRIEVESIDDEIIMNNSLTVSAKKLRCKTIVEAVESDSEEESKE